MYPLQLQVYFHIEKISFGSTSLKCSAVTLTHLPHINVTLQEDVYEIDQEIEDILDQYRPDPRFPVHSDLEVRKRTQFNFIDVNVSP